MGSVSGGRWGGGFGDGFNLCKVAEKLYELSVTNNMTIVPADMPLLYTHTPNSLDKYIRKIVFATTELERAHAVSRLQDGLARKMTTTKRLGQNCAPKVHCALSMPSPYCLCFKSFAFECCWLLDLCVVLVVANAICLGHPGTPLSLEKLAKHNGVPGCRGHGLPAHVLRMLNCSIVRRQRNPSSFGLRSLASAMSAVLKLKRPMAHETARGLSLSLQPPTKPTSRPNVRRMTM